jgi:hypothetical protein
LAIVIPILITAGEITVSEEAVAEPTFKNILPFEMGEKNGEVAGVSHNGYHLAIVQSEFSGKIAKLLGGEIVVIEKSLTGKVKVSVYNSGEKLNVEQTSLESWKANHPKTDIYPVS